MATDLKISQLPDLGNLFQPDDLIAVVDISTNITKKGTLEDMMGAFATNHTPLFPDLATNNALWRTDAPNNVIAETTTLLTEPAANQFTLTRGTSSLNVSGEAYIDQGVRTSDSPGFFTLLFLIVPLASTSGGTGFNTYTDGQLLIGNTGTGLLNKSTLTGTANQVTVTNAAGSITLSTPQSIATSSTPTFNGMTLTSTTQGFTVPRMTTAQKNALSAVNGMIVYDTDLNKFQGYEGGAWTSFI